MKRTILALLAIATSNLGALPGPMIAARAATLPPIDSSLCTDSWLLGPSQDKHHWGTPFILPPGDDDISVTFEGPFSEGATEYLIATVTTTTQAIFQRCPVVNGQDKPTGRHQDIEVASEETSVSVFNCQTNLTPEGQALGYVECPTGGSDTDRKNHQ